MSDLEFYCVLCNNTSIANTDDCESDPICNYGDDSCDCCGRDYFVKCTKCGEIVCERVD